MSDGQDKGLRRQTGGVGGRPALGVLRRASGSATGQRTGVGRGESEAGRDLGVPVPQACTDPAGEWWRGPNSRDTPAKTRGQRKNRVSHQAEGR